MPIEIDHVYVCCEPGAPEGDALLDLGLREGSRNTHPGQGTANRRFFFANAYIELIWVRDSQECLSEPARRTRLYERCQGRVTGACPFGIVFRPAPGSVGPPPFSTWSYRPSYLPPGLSIEIAAGTSLHEPELIFLPFALNRGRHDEPLDHDVPLGRLAAVSIGLPGDAEHSAPLRCAMREGVNLYRDNAGFSMNIEFDGATCIECDLRPTLPLVLRGRP